jgi:hypothetical protein
VPSNHHTKQRYLAIIINHHNWSWVMVTPEMFGIHNWSTVIIFFGDSYGSYMVGIWPYFTSIKKVLEDPHLPQAVLPKCSQPFGGKIGDPVNPVVAKSCTSWWKKSLLILSHDLQYFIGIPRITPNWCRISQMTEVRIQARLLWRRRETGKPDRGSSIALGYRWKFNWWSNKHGDLMGFSMGFN